MVGSGGGATHGRTFVDHSQLMFFFFFNFIWLSFLIILREISKHTHHFCPWSSSEGHSISCTTANHWKAFMAYIRTWISSFFFSCSLLLKLQDVQCCISTSWLRNPTRSHFNIIMLINIIFKIMFRLPWYQLTFHSKVWMRWF